MLSARYLIWIDLEMTGLDPAHDVILEIATIITDNQLTIIAKGPSLVIHHSHETLARMNEWNIKQHTASGLIEQVHASPISLAEAEKQTLHFVQQWCIPQTAPLCGNTVYQDRSFLQAYMPHLNLFAHYRLIDVSTIKELVNRWYPYSPHAHYKKKEAHRALDDIYASVEELNHYRTYFFIPSLAP